MQSGTTGNDADPNVLFAASGLRDAVAERDAEPGDNPRDTADDEIAEPASEKWLLIWPSVGT